MKKIIFFTLTALLTSFLFSNKYMKETFAKEINKSLFNKEDKRNQLLDDFYRNRITFNKDQPIEIIEYKKSKKNMFYN